MRTILRYRDLKAKGVAGSRQTLHRLRKDDPTFPVAVLIGAGIGWHEHEIDAWLAARPRVRKGWTPVSRQGASPPQNTEPSPALTAEGGA